MAHNQRLGQRGEDAAAAWYSQAGYEVLDRNWRCRQGELDLIVARPEMVVFVEVKARSSSRFGAGLEAVDWRKQQKIRTLARLWLAQSDHYYRSIRFDVVDVDGSGHLSVLEGCF